MDEVSVTFGGAYRGRRVLVTGHTGFKGSWLSLWLKNLGADVAGYSLGLPTEPCNFAILDLQRHIQHHPGDIRDLPKLARVLDEFRPDIIFHLAAQSLVRRSYVEPALTFETNAMGMVNVLEAVRRRPWITAVVLITSDKAYRNDDWCWSYRETDTLGGKDPYSGSKGCAELIAYSYYHSFLKDGPTNVAVTRAGNVIGGGDWAADRIVPDCIRAWCDGESVAVRNPLATRPWQHVLEPMSAYLWLGSKLMQGSSGLNGEAFNFGPEANVNATVQQLLAEMVPKWPGARWHTPDRSEKGGQEATLLKLSCEKALSQLQWRATLNFDQTVDFTVDWYRSWHEGGVQMYEYAAAQIERYCDIARDRGIDWAMQRGRNANV